MYALFNRFEIQMTKEQALSCSYSGAYDDDVKAIIQLPKIKRQLKKIALGDIQEELMGYGAWDDVELLDDMENQKRIIWIAACQIREEMQTKRKD